MNTDSFICSGKQSSLYIIFDKFVSTSDQLLLLPQSLRVRCHPVLELSSLAFLSVKFFSCTCDWSHCSYLFIAYFLLSLYNSLIYVCHLTRILSCAIMMLPSLTSMHVVTHALSASNLVCLVRCFELLKPITVLSKHYFFR